LLDILVVILDMGGSIWACRECLGHPICKNKREKM
jgi:hypothetical protein